MTVGLDRLHTLIKYPIKHKGILCAPLLGPIMFDISMLSQMERVHVGGESGPDSRPVYFEWVKDIRDQCVTAGVEFVFDKTGEIFYKEGKRYKIPVKLCGRQALKANLKLLMPN